MTDYGGLGGIRGGRSINHEDRFEMDLATALGSQMIASDDLCERVWGSLANVDWVHESGDTAGYSFRAAGDLIAAIIGRGDYMDWYCSAPYGNADAEVEAAMLTRGWRPEEAAE